MTSRAKLSNLHICTNYRYTTTFRISLQDIIVYIFHVLEFSKVIMYNENHTNIIEFKQLNKAHLNSKKIYRDIYNKIISTL